MVMGRRERRFQRQFDALERLQDSWFPIRFPIALMLVAGGLLSFLPVLGIWMLPLGLLLLAVDLPVLRSPISGLIIRTRRKGKLWLRRWRRRHSRH
jgi:hypothetical protein